MEISRNKWHYKVSKRYIEGFNEARTLCQYMNRIFWSLVITSVLSVFLAVVLIGLAVIIPSMFSSVLTVSAVPTQSWLSACVGLTLLVSIIGGIVGTILSILYVSKKLENTKLSDAFSSVYEAAKPNILIEYIRAKKNKYCPIVRFKD